jgi:hypothetical protein
VCQVYGFLFFYFFTNHLQKPRKGQGKTKSRMGYRINVFFRPKLNRKSASNVHVGCGPGSNPDVRVLWVCRFFFPFFSSSEGDFFQTAHLRPSRFQPISGWKVCFGLLIIIYSTEKLPTSHHLDPSLGNTSNRTWCTEHGLFR